MNSRNPSGVRRSPSGVLPEYVEECKVLPNCQKSSPNIYGFCLQRGMGYGLLQLYGLWSVFPCEPTRWTEKPMGLKGVWGNWAMGYEGVDCTLICTYSPFLWHTLHFFPLCLIIISSLGKHMAWPSWHHSSSSLSFTNWLDSVVKAARYMHVPGSNSRQVISPLWLFTISGLNFTNWLDSVVKAACKIYAQPRFKSRTCH